MFPVLPILITPGLRETYRAGFRRTWELTRVWNRDMRTEILAQHPDWEVHGKVLNTVWYVAIAAAGRVQPTTHFSRFSVLTDTGTHLLQLV